MGNLRAMHQPVAAGRVIHFEPRDLAREFYIGAEVVDENEWEKVLKGVYTGFSIGGKYGERWDEGGVHYYEAIPKEVSLVDKPCHPGATFEMVLVDGTVELMKLEDLAKHYGPGAHKSGTSQDVHAGEDEHHNSDGSHKKPSWKEKRALGQNLTSSELEAEFAEFEENKKRLRAAGMPHRFGVDWTKDQEAAIEEMKAMERPNRPALDPDIEARMKEGQYDKATAREKMNQREYRRAALLRGLKQAHTPNKRLDSIYVDNGGGAQWAVQDGMLIAGDKNAEMRRLAGAAPKTPLDSIGTHYGDIADIELHNGKTAKGEILNFDPEANEYIVDVDNYGWMRIDADELSVTKLEQETSMSKAFPPKKQDGKEAAPEATSGQEDQAQAQPPNGKEDPQTNQPAGAAQAPAKEDPMDIIAAALKDGTMSETVAAQLKAAINTEETSEAIPGANPNGQENPEAGDLSGTPAGPDPKELRQLVLSLLEELGLVERTESGAMKVEPAGMLQKGDVESDLQKRDDMLTKAMTDGDRALAKDIATLAIGLEKFEQRLGAMAGFGPIVREIGTGTASAADLQKADQLRNAIAATPAGPDREALQLELTQLGIRSVHANPSAQ